MIQNIIVDIIDGVCKSGQSILADLLVMLMNMMELDQFAPTIEWFRENLGEILNNGDIYDIMVNFTRNVGYGLILIFLAWNLVLLSIGSVYDFKQSIFQMIQKVAIAIVLVSIINPLSLKLGEYANIVYESLGDIQAGAIGYDAEGWIKNSSASPESETFWEGVLDDATRTFNDSSPEEIASSLGLMGSYKLLTDVAGQTANPAPLLFAVIYIIRVILYCGVLYEFFKMCLELVKKYAFMCVLLMFMPALASTYACPETEQIFKTSFKTVITSFISVTLSHFFMAFSLYLMHVLPASFVGSAMMIAFINIGSRIDSHLKDLGFSVSSSSMAMLDSILGAGSNIANMVKGFSQTGGKGMVNAGTALGLPALAAAGNVMQGRSASPVAVAKAMNDSLVGGVLAAANGHTPLTAASMNHMDRLFAMGSGDAKSEFGKAFNALDKNERQKYLDHLKNTKFDNDEFKNALGITQEQFENGVQLKDITDRGNIIGTMSTDLGSRDFEISSDELGIKESKSGHEIFNGEDGKSYHVNFAKGPDSLKSTNNTSDSKGSSSMVSETGSETPNQENNAIKGRTLSDFATESQKAQMRALNGKQDNHDTIKNAENILRQTSFGKTSSANVKDVANLMGGMTRTESTINDKGEPEKEYYKGDFDMDHYRYNFDQNNNLASIDYDPTGEFKTTPKMDEEGNMLDKNGEITLVANNAEQIPEYYVGAMQYDENGKVMYDFNDNESADDFDHNYLKDTDNNKLNYEAVHKLGFADPKQVKVADYYDQNNKKDGYVLTGKDLEGNEIKRHIRPTVSSKAVSPDATLHTKYSNKVKRVSPNLTVAEQSNNNKKPINENNVK